jgi:hypothetical protein
MTMHLVGPYMTTTNYKKRKHKKLTSNQLEKLRVEWRRYNKDCRRKHMHSAQFQEFEDYLKYIRGEYKPKAEFKTYEPKPKNPLRTETHYPSVKTSNSVPGYAPRKEPNVYTGDLIKGIATMHKSNAVPITSKQAAIDVANMRRG